MFFALAFLLSSSLAGAQIYGPPPPAAGGGSTTTSAAPAPVPSAPPDTPGAMNIDVAFDSGFTFHPANISAPNGTTVTFWFPNNGQFNHSVTQSSFDNPCTHLAATSNSPAGFDSGLVGGVQFTINITDDSQPIWFHCKQVLHCGMGMVGSINAPSSGNNTFGAFQAAAQAIGSNEPTETDTGAVTGGVNAVATATPAATGSGIAPSSSPASGAGRLVVSGSGAMAVVVAAIFVALA